MPMKGINVSFTTFATIQLLTSMAFMAAAQAFHTARGSRVAVFGSPYTGVYFAIALLGSTIIVAATINLLRWAFENKPAEGQLPQQEKDEPGA